MQTLNRLTALEVKSAEPGKYADGGGLWLHKRPGGGGQWFLRVTVHGRRREMGLGSIARVSLKEVRQKAEEWRSVARQGKDPIKERERDRREAISNLHCLNDVAHELFESLRADLKNEGAARRWFSTLELHVLKKLGKVPVAEIDQIDIRDTLRPIWYSKADTARKALDRLGMCLKHAAALGLDVDLQATDKAKALLGSQNHTVQHIPAMPWQDVPAFYATLSDGTVTHLAFRLLILTAIRSKPLRFMHCDQIEDEIWTIPADLMKGRKSTTTEFRVPLSPQAMAIVEQAKNFERDGFLFPSVRKGVISDATMSRHMERRQMVARPHGFRSSFRDWVAETTDTPYEIAEYCLGHVIGNSVARAYHRTDYLERRRGIMERWASFISSPNSEE